jgi:Domain of unknown function (DUF4258)
VAVTPSDALRAAALAGRLNRFQVSGHALLRMRHRNVTRQDIASALASARTAAPEAETRWKLLGGCDCDGDVLTVVVAFDAGTIVVTVF